MGPETNNAEHLAKLKPHLEEALRTLSRLERHRGLSDKDLVRKEACRRMLLMVGEGSSRPRSMWE